MSDFVLEDRCHLNGLGLKKGLPQTVTALGMADEARGWRPQKVDSGVIIDVPAGEIILRGLCMPHSPRWGDGSLWVLNSGKGELLVVDEAPREMEVVCRLPDYLRGMRLVGQSVVVGPSKIRGKRFLRGFPLKRRKGS